MPCRIFDLIKNSTKILLISHVNPDGDTLGAAGAFWHYGKENDKQVDFFCLHEVPKIFEYLGFKKTITKESLELNNYDLVIILDNANIKRTGIPEKIKNCKVPLVNIDHHNTNLGFGTYNLIKADYSSTCEIVYELFNNCRENFSPQSATCLLTGILTDTDNFTNAATRNEAVAAAADLIKNGADIKKANQNIWKIQTADTLKIWGKILANLHFLPEEKIVMAVLTEEDLANPDAVDGVANFLTKLYEANIIWVVQQHANNIIKCSLRTTKDNIDVSAIAKNFDGGGHQKAAGFSFPGTLKKIAGKWHII